jgi:molybdenum cofactor guanylyltransferase
MPSSEQPVGVVLAGGEGRRMGGSKLTVQLRGRALIEYPLEVLCEVLDEVHVIAKPDVKLPPLPGMTVWLEPQTPRHPLVGIVEALAIAAPAPVLVCPADLPFVTPALIHRLAFVDAQGAPVVVASCAGEPQPLLGRYSAAAMQLLAEDARVGQVPVRQAVAALQPRLLEVDDPDELFNVNSPEDLLLASAMLDRQER